MNIKVCSSRLPLVSHWWEICLLRQTIVRTVLMNDFKATTPTFGLNDTIILLAVERISGVQFPVRVREPASCLMGTWGWTLAMKWPKPSYGHSLPTSSRLLSHPCSIVRTRHTQNLTLEYHAAMLNRVTAIYFWGVHPIAFNYYNYYKRAVDRDWMFFISISLTTTCFGPYGPSSGVTYFSHFFW
jgi:hypothetical protein